MASISLDSEDNVIGEVQIAPARPAGSVTTEVTGTGSIVTLVAVRLTLISAAFVRENQLVHRAIDRVDTGVQRGGIGAVGEIHPVNRLERVAAQDACCCRWRTGLHHGHAPEPVG